MFPNPDACEAGGLGAHLSTSVGHWSRLFPLGSVLTGAVGDSGAWARVLGCEGCGWPGE